MEGRLSDPTDEVRPDFSLPKYVARRNAVANGEADEIAIQRLSALWDSEHEERVAAWQEQQEQDAADAEARHLEQEQQEEARKAKKAKSLPDLPPIRSNVPPPSVLPLRPSQFAIDKLARETPGCPDMWYFTPEGCREAARQPVPETNTFALEQGEGGTILRPVAAHTPSRRAVPDALLSLDQILQASHILLRELKRAGWDDAHVDALIAFYYKLQRHSLRGEEHGEEILVAYHDQVRREWFAAIKSRETHLFDISIINEDLMAGIALKLSMRRGNTVTSEYVFLSLASCLLLINAPARLSTPRIMHPVSRNMRHPCVPALAHLDSRLQCIVPLTPSSAREDGRHPLLARTPPGSSGRTTSLRAVGRAKGEIRRRGLSRTRTPFESEGQAGKRPRRGAHAPSVWYASEGLHTTHCAVRPQEPGTGSGFAATGTSAGRSSTRKGSNSASTGSWQKAARPPTASTYTSAQAVDRGITAQMRALELRKLSPCTPYIADAWQSALRDPHLHAKYPTLIHSLRHGFNIGFPCISSTHAPLNSPSLLEHKAAFEEIIAREFQRERYLGPFSQTEVEEALGPFQTSPLSLIPKPHKPSALRLI
ncbi:hypothetical protein EVG20_g10133, partial [Dentipellis fragilis]